LPLAALEQLSRLHAEQARSAQRMMFLDGSANAALALMLLGVAVIALGAGTSLPLCFAWSLLLLLAIIALLRCHLRVHDRIGAMRAARDLRAVLFYAGCAWGSGALLVLPPVTYPAAALPFAVAPSAILATLLKDRGGALAFLMPVTAGAIAAAILRPWPDAGLATALLLMLQSGIAALAILRDRRAEKIPPGLALHS